LAATATTGGLIGPLPWVLDLTHGGPTALFVVIELALSFDWLLLLLLLGLLATLL
jgi:hypothetical protein